MHERSRETAAEQSKAANLAVMVTARKETRKNAKIERRIETLLWRERETGEREKPDKTGNFLIKSKLTTNDKRSCEAFVYSFRCTAR